MSPETAGLQRSFALDSDILAPGSALNVDLSGSMSGTLKNPTFRGAFAIVQGEYQGTTLPDLRGRFGYADRELVTHVDALRNGGATLFLTTLTRARAPIASWPDLSVSIRRMSRRTEA